METEAAARVKTNLNKQLPLCVLQMALPFTKWRFAVRPATTHLKHHCTGGTNRMYIKSSAGLLIIRTEKEEEGARFALPATNRWPILAKGRKEPSEVCTSHQQSTAELTNRSERQQEEKESLKASGESMLLWPTGGAQQLDHSPRL